MNEYNSSDIDYNDVGNRKRTLDYETEYRGEVHDQSYFEYDGSPVKKRMDV